MIEIEVNFRDQTSLDRSAREGWGDAEGFGAWMTGAVSRLVLPPPPRHDGDFVLRAVIGPMLHPGVLDRQRFRILVNGHPVFETAMAGLWSINCPVPAAAITAQPRVEIIIEHPDAASAVELGTGHDLRPIAGGIWSLTLLGHSPLPEMRAPVFSRPVFLTRPIGNLANRMIQHMVALSVQARAPNCQLAGMELDEWGIRSRPDDGTWADLALTDEQFIDVAGTAALLQSQTVSKIVHRGYGQRMENFLPREAYRPVFRADLPEISGFDARHLVMNIRSGDIVEGLVRDYVLTPLHFYRDLIAATGLIPVFMGQLEPNAYTDALRAAFPDALFLDSQGPMGDFEIVRRSKNVVASVSTFSWLAAWLSDAEQIFLPVNGLFNPLQFRPVDLLPLNDPRYRFFLFPVNHAAPDFAAAHAAIDGQWREVTADELAEIRRNLPPVEPSTPEPKPAPEPPAPSQPALAPVAAAGHPAVLEDLAPFLATAEAAAGRGYAVDVLYYLRQLPLIDYADLMWSLPRADLPGISALLPRMAPEEAQLGWNGKSGAELCHHTVDFVRILSAGFQRITGRSLEGQRVLDFGCGWGRVLRMLYYFTDPQNCCGVDAMDQAIGRCRADGVLGELVHSNYIAEELKVGERRYDLIFAYSVFTHTPLRVAQVALATLRRKLRNNGLLAITIRPVEFWAMNTALPAEQARALAASHRASGFSFLPLGVTAPNGEDIYGETSMTPAWLAAHFPDWEVEGYDRGLDPLQMIVFLTPR